MSTWPHSNITKKKLQKPDMTWEDNEHRFRVRGPDEI